MFFGVGLVIDGIWGVLALDVLFLGWLYFDFVVGLVWCCFGFGMGGLL